MRLFHRDLGGDGRPPLLLLHGFLGSSRNWQTAGRDLAARHHVYALDLRNHGDSPHADLMSHAVLAEDVLAWLDWRGIPAATVLGHSLGGKVAMLLACRQPERIVRLVVVDIAPRDYRHPERRAEFAAMNALDLAELPSRAEAERRMAADVPDWAMRKFLLTNLERTPEGGWRWSINLPVLARSAAALEANPLRPVDRCDGPALFLAGGKSRYIGADDAAVIRRHFPAAQLVTLPESGHNPHIDAREAFVRAVDAFV